MSLEMMQRMAIVVPFTLILVVYVKHWSLGLGLAAAVLFYAGAQFYMKPMKLEVKKEEIYSRYESKSPEDKFAAIEFKKCIDADKSNKTDCRVSVGNLAERINGTPFKSKVVKSLSELTTELDKS